MTGVFGCMWNSTEKSTKYLSGVTRFGLTFYIEAQYTFHKSYYFRQSGCLY